MNNSVRRAAAAVLVCALLQVPLIVIAQDQGIKVHGHWTIDVRQPDGTLVAHRQFENALLSAFGNNPSGHTTLARVLGREFAIPQWIIYLGTAEIPTTPPCPGTPSLPSIRNGIYGAGMQSGCFLTEGPNPFGTLTVSGVDSQVILTGTAKALRAGKVGQVLALMAPEAIFPYFPISGTELPSPIIEVTEGQIIQVTVRISFQ